MHDIGSLRIETKGMGYIGELGSGRFSTVFGFVLMTFPSVGRGEEMDAVFKQAVVFIWA